VDQAAARRNNITGVPSLSTRGDGEGEGGEQRDDDQQRAVGPAAATVGDLTREQGRLCAKLSADGCGFAWLGCSTWPTPICPAMQANVCAIPQSPAWRGDQPTGLSERSKLGSPEQTRAGPTLRSGRGGAGLTPCMAAGSPCGQDLGQDADPAIIDADGQRHHRHKQRHRRLRPCGAHLCASSYCTAESRADWVAVFFLSK
jgi:hypothetical protein